MTCSQLRDQSCAIDGYFLPQAEARGLEIVRLHQTLVDWRDRRRLADAAGWPTLATHVIGVEIRAVEREIARRVRELF
ncbi:hypothetical protein [Methylosinus sp. R-45379]|uniref:hypothetical protein n=1 Tax=Methylosinus sp. R-45379 TaxID=980563 RepID=UPI0012EE7991|nr:hypothetical protein [Methylosinus sp. R-45379]